MNHSLSNALILNSLLADEYGSIINCNRGGTLGEETERTSTKSSRLISELFLIYPVTKLMSIQGSEFLFNGR